MGKIIILIFCYLIGRMTFSFGWWSLLWVPLGYCFGLCLSGPQIIPIYKIFYSFYLIIRKKILVRVLLPVTAQFLFWNIIIFGGFVLFVIFLPTYAEAVSNCVPANLAYWLGMASIILSPLDKRGRIIFLEDYNESCGKYML